MARSRRKTPIVAVTTARSDKPFKVDEHRSERRTARVAVRKTLDGDDRALHAERHGDPWRAPKYGKTTGDPNRETCGSRTMEHSEFRIGGSFGAAISADAAPTSAHA